MNTSEHDNPTEANDVAPLDPQRVFDSVVSELECLTHDAAPGIGSDLVELHGALLAYNLDGRAELLPSPTFGLSTRSWRERRVLRAARRIMTASGDPTAVLDLADRIIRQRLHLIDPELSAFAA
jgi:hypothetical protein